MCPVGCRDYCLGPSALVGGRRSWESSTPSFFLAHIHEPSCLLLVPELIDEELYLEVGRGAGGGSPTPPPIDARFLPRVGHLKLARPSSGGLLLSDSVSEAVIGLSWGLKNTGRSNRVPHSIPGSIPTPQAGKFSSHLF